MQSSLLASSRDGGGDEHPSVASKPSTSSSRLKSLSQAIMSPTPMTAEEALTMSPWEKFREHRRVPWKFISHVIILGLCWYQVELYTLEVVPYFLDSRDALAEAFFGFDLPDGRVEAERSASSGLLVLGIAQQSAFRSAVTAISSTNLNFDLDSVDDYDPIRCTGNSGTARPCRTLPDGTNPGVHVHIKWNDPKTRTPPVPKVPCGDASSCEFDIGQDAATCTGADEVKETSDGCLGHFANFSDTEWTSFFQRVETMHLAWNLRDRDVRFLHQWNACRASNCSVNWHMSAHFSFTSAGKLQVVYSSMSSLAYDDDSDDLMDDRVNTPDVWEWRSMWLVEIVVAALSLCLCIRAYHANWVNTIALRRYPNSGASRRLAAKRSASRNWLALTILQNLFNIISAVRMMNPYNVVQGAAEVDYILAASVFLTFVNTTRFLEFFPDFYVLITTVVGGLPSVLRFMVGCTPIYLGFATGNLIFAGCYPRSIVLYLSLNPSCFCES